MGRNTSDARENNHRANRVRGTPGSSSGQGSREDIEKWLNQVRFKKTVFGGVQESDVWKKIAELNTMYEQALTAERVRYDTLLKERAEVMAQEMYRQMVSSDGEQERSGDVESK